MAGGLGSGRSRVSGSLREFLAPPGRRRRLLQAAAGLVAAATVAGAFHLGQVRAGHNILEARLREQGLQEQLAALQAEGRETRQAQARQETNALVDREACTQIEAQLPELQDKILAQQEELAFYRGIVGGPGQGGLRVQEFAQVALAGGGTRIRFILTRIEHAERQVRGQLQLRVEGKRAGRFTSLDLASLAMAPGSTPRDFDFRYFQEISTGIRLPADFSPERIVIRVMPVTAGVRASVESFPWAAGAGAQP